MATGSLSLCAMILSGRQEQARWSARGGVSNADGLQDGDDRDPFAEAEEQEALRESEAKRRNIAMLRQMAPSQVRARSPQLKRSSAAWHSEAGNSMQTSVCMPGCGKLLFKSSECLTHQAVHTSAELKGWCDAAQAAPAAGAPLALGGPQPASTQAASTGQSLFGGFGAASAPASASPGSAFNFAGSTGVSLFGGAPASSPGLFGGAGAFGASNTLTSQPSRKGKGRK